MIEEGFEDVMMPDEDDPGDDAGKDYNEEIGN